jgi:DNA-binding response OmpR family regulator
MTDHMQTLIVDDEESIRFVLAETVQRDGHMVSTAENGEEALDYLRETPFDLVLLDLMLGGRVDGLEVLKAVRWRWPDAVVIILTAHGSLETAMEAIRGGIDRYLLKPIRPDDLRAAIDEALQQQRRRSSRETLDKKKDRILQYGPFTVDLHKHIMTLFGKVIELTPREFKLLVHLMQNAHRVVPPTELVQVVRQYNCQDVYEARQIIKWYIHRLRHKVEPDPAHSRYILSIRGVGYRFKE